MMKRPVPRVNMNEPSTRALTNATPKIPRTVPKNP